MKIIVMEMKDGGAGGGGWVSLWYSTKGQIEQ